MNRPCIAVYGAAARAALVGAAVMLALAGCGPSKPSVVAPMQKEIISQETQIQQLQQRVANQQETIENQRKQIASLQQLGARRPSRLAPVEGIKFASLSGGYDENGDGSHDGVVVYVQPYDGDGDILKTSGELTIRLFDLSNPAGPKLIRQYTWNSEQLRKIWSGRLMTSHFSARCPWPEDFQPPRQVTAQAQFLDYVTGKTFTQQAVFQIKSTEPGR
jgi:uncharacterized coiled-coil protein SlyX